MLPAPVGQSASYLVKTSDCFTGREMVLKCLPFVDKAGGQEAFLFWFWKHRLGSLTGPEHS